MEDVRMAKRGTSGRYTPPSSRRYTAELKRDAVALLRLSERSIAAVAKELGVSDATLGGLAAWAREEEKMSGAADIAETEADRLEAIQLSKRIEELEQEIEILKRFTAFWVKEGGQWRRPRWWHSAGGWASSRPTPRSPGGWPPSTTRVRTGPGYSVSSLSSRRTLPSPRCAGSVECHARPTTHGGRRARGRTTTSSARHVSPTPSSMSG